MQYDFLKEETLKENNLLVEYHTHTQKKTKPNNPKNSLFSMFTQSFYIKISVTFPSNIRQLHLCFKKKLVTQGY